MSFKPVGFKILVLPAPKRENATVGGLEIVNNTLAEGTVVEVPDTLSPIYKKGDTVYFPPNAGVEFPYEGKVHKILNGQETPAGDIWGKEE